MSLDFAVLGVNGAPERTISIKAHLHHELIDRAAAHGSARLQPFADYYEDAEIPVDDLSGLSEQVENLRSSIASAELQLFLDELSDLLAHAAAHRKVLHVIAD